MKELSRQTVILLGFIVVGGTAFGAWQFVFSPLNEREETFRRVREELDKKELERDTMVHELKLNETAQKQMSLPADQSLALNEYGKLLQNLLLSSNLTVRDIKPGQPDSRNAPTLGNKKPAYTKLTYAVQMRGDLYSLVEFLYTFYRQPLLHQIRKLNIQVPQASSNTRGAPKTEDLEVTMTIEALIIDKAENRPTLFAVPTSMSLVASGLGGTAWMMHPSKNQGYGSPFDLPSALGRLKELGRFTTDKKHAAIPQEYLKIPGKNIFSGPAPAAPVGQKQVAPPEKDYSPYFKLNEITIDTEGNSQASIRNLMLKYDYTVTQSAKGDIGIKAFYYMNKTVGDHTVSTRKPYGSSTKGKLEFGDKEKGNFKEFMILNLVDNTDILIQRIEDYTAYQPIQKAASLVFGGSAPKLFPGKVYRWHVGQSLGEAVDKKMGTILDENGEEQPGFISATPLAPHVATAAMLTHGPFPENLPDPKKKTGSPGWPKKNGWGKQNAGDRGQPNLATPKTAFPKGKEKFQPRSK